MMFAFTIAALIAVAETALIAWLIARDNRRKRTWAPPERMRLLAISITGTSVSANIDTRKAA